MKKLVIVVSYRLSLFRAFSCNGNKKPANSKRKRRGKERRRTGRRSRDRRDRDGKFGAYGTIKIELYSNIAPKMVDRFKELAKEGVYDGDDLSPDESVGDPGRRSAVEGQRPENDGTGKSDKPNVEAEFSDIPVRHRHRRCGSRTRTITRQIRSFLSR